MKRDEIERGINMLRKNNSMKKILIINVNSMMIRARETLAINGLQGVLDLLLSIIAEIKDAALVQKMLSDEIFNNDDTIIKIVKEALLKIKDESKQ